MCAATGNTLFLDPARVLPGEVLCLLFGLKVPVDESFRSYSGAENKVARKIDHSINYLDRNLHCKHCHAAFGNGQIIKINWQEGMGEEW